MCRHKNGDDGAHAQHGHALVHYYSFLDVHGLLVLSKASLDGQVLQQSVILPVKDLDIIRRQVREFKAFIAVHLTRSMTHKRETKKWKNMDFAPVRFYSLSFNVP